MTKHSKHPRICIIGGGMAGIEAAWYAAKHDIPTRLYEMRPNVMTPAHQTDKLAEMVCSNSLRSDDDNQNAVGLLHYEMRKGGSLLMQAAEHARVPAGSALAVDRGVLSDFIEQRLAMCDNLEIVREGVEQLPDDDGDCQWIVATGPLTHSALAQDIARLSGAGHLAFFDAIAPIVHADTIDRSIVWEQSRYDKGDGKDYLNCPMDKEQYQQFISDICSAESKEFHAWERDTPYFESCLPIEVMAGRGVETLRFGPMKPVGLTNSHDPQTKPYAVVQLRRENLDATLWNIVGFQTKMIYQDQLRIFRSIPGLAQADFARLGGIHRNMFVNAPKVLDDELRLIGGKHIRLAGQITGVEGYVESAAVGMMAARFAVCDILGAPKSIPNKRCAFGALYGHLRNALAGVDFQPMNVNFGLFEPLEQTGGKPIKGRLRKQAYCDRAKEAVQQWNLLPFGPPQ